ncbi:RlpA-like double-psi beta-barrel-protein domain-containing protein-containing protein, partial [Pseudomassariella vexata]
STTEIPIVAAAAPSAASSSSSSGDSSGGADVHSGDITYYTVGPGACGYDDSGADETKNIVAIAADDFGPLTSLGVNQPANPLCDQTITISANGKTTTATIRDKCPGCDLGSIDVSSKTFMELFGSLDGGREPVTWWYN